MPGRGHVLWSGATGKRWPARAVCHRSQLELARQRVRRQRRQGQQAVLLTLIRAGDLTAVIDVDLGEVPQNT